MFEAKSNLSRLVEAVEKGTERESSSPETASRLPSSPPFSGAAAQGYFREAGYELLSVSGEHAAGVDSLRQHHGEPFDRLLAAQALTEPLRLLTDDAKLAAYGETILQV